MKCNILTERKVNLESREDPQKNKGEDRKEEIKCVGRI